MTTRPELPVWLPIVTDDDSELTNFPLAVAVAVTDVPDDKLNPVFVHDPEELVVVVPTETPLAKTSIVVPLASVDVPVIDVIEEAVQ